MIISFGLWFVDLHFWFSFMNGTAHIARFVGVAGEIADQSAGRPAMRPARLFHAGESRHTFHYSRLEKKHTFFFFLHFFFFFLIYSIKLSLVPLSLSIRTLNDVIYRLHTIEGQLWQVDTHYDAPLPREKVVFWRREKCCLHFECRESKREGRKRRPQQQQMWQRSCVITLVIKKKRTNERGREKKSSARPLSSLRSTDWTFSPAAPPDRLALNHLFFCPLRECDTRWAWVWSCWWLFDVTSS